jgi:hypothetical protein
MKSWTGFSIVLATILGLGAVTGCIYEERTVSSDGSTVQTDTAVVVADPPPPPIVEETVLAPGPGYIWITGTWVWTDRWVWQRGYWARPPRAGAVWVPGRYAYRNGAHVYYRGKWRYQ